jgi:hypothetical protein
MTTTAVFRSHCQCCFCRLSLLHRAVYIHFPDDRMLVAGQEPAPAADQAAGGAASSQRKHRHKLDPRKVCVGGGGGGGRHISAN